MLGYVASAYVEDGLSGPKLLDATVSDVRNTVSKAKFDALRDGSVFWKEVMGDEKSMGQMVPLYSMRVFYVESMRLLHSFGQSYTSASIQIAAFFGALTVLILAAIVIELNLPALLLPVVIGASGFLETAMMPSPDTMACFLALAVTYLLMVGRLRAILPLMVVMPLARTDLVILSGLLSIYIFFNGRGRVGKAAVIVAALLSVVAYVAVNKLHGNYGLLNLFNNHHIRHSIYPADVEISTNPRDYLMPYLWVVRDAINSTHAAVFLFAAAILIYSRRAGAFVEREYPLFIMPMAFTLLHVLAFPAYFERYFEFSVILTLVGSLHFLKQYGAAPNRSIGATT